MQRQLLEDREEYVGKLKLELEEKYQETLKTAKQNWLKEQEAGVKERAEEEVTSLGERGWVRVSSGHSVYFI